jgi:hypothetical protein
MLGKGITWIADIHLENSVIEDAQWQDELATTLSVVVERLRNKTLGNQTCSKYESPNKTTVSLIGGLLQDE